MAEAIAPPPAVPTPSPFVFFRASRSFRSPKVIVATVFSAVFAAFFWWLVSLPKGPNTAGKNVPTILACAASLIMLVGLRRAVAREIWELVISTEGVHYGNESWQWNQITAVGHGRLTFSPNYALRITVEEDPVEAHDVLASAGAGLETCAVAPEIPRIVLLLVDQSITRDASSRLLMAVGTWLRSNYPHVRVNDS